MASPVSLKPCLQGQPCKPPQTFRRPRPRCEQRRERRKTFCSIPFRSTPGFSRRSISKSKVQAAVSPSLRRQILAASLSTPRLKTRHRTGSNLHREKPRPCPLWTKSGLMRRSKTLDGGQLFVGGIEVSKTIPSSPNLFCLGRIQASVT